MKRVPSIDYIRIRDELGDPQNLCTFNTPYHPCFIELTTKSIDSCRKTLTILRQPNHFTQSKGFIFAGQHLTKIEECFLFTVAGILIEWILVVLTILRKQMIQQIAYH